MSQTPDRIRWIKPKLERETLRRLTTKNDARAWLQILSEMALVAGSGVLAYHAVYNWPPAAGLPLLYLYFIFYSWFTREAVFHELLHGTPFSRKGVNEFFFRLATFLGWMNGDYVRTGHMSHHQVTMHEGQDQDVALDLKFNTPWEIPMALLFHLRHFLRDVGTLFRTSVGRFSSDWERELFPESKPKARRRLARTARLTLLGHLLLIVLFIATGQWLLLFMISLGAFFATWPHLLASMTQHVGMHRNVNDWRRNSRSIRVDPLTGFLYWRMQYHIEHHMYPSVPFYNLPELRRELEAFLPPRKRLRTAWKDILQYLKDYRTDPDARVEVGELAEIPE